MTSRATLLGPDDGALLQKAAWEAGAVRTLASSPAIDNCALEEITMLLDPKASLIERIGAAASAVANHCEDLTMEDQKRCASQLFGVPMDCSLTRWFRVVYAAACTRYSPDHA